MRRRRAWRCNESLMLLQRDAIESNLQSVFSGNCRKLAVRDKGGVSRQPYSEHHATVSTTSGTQMRLLSANRSKPCPPWTRAGRGRFRNPLGLDTSDGHGSLLVLSRKLSSLTFANPMRIIVNCTKKKMYTSVDVQGGRLGLDCTLLCFTVEGIQRGISWVPYGDTG